MHRVLYAEGVAAPLERGFAPVMHGALEDELPRVVSAIQALVQL